MGSVIACVNSSWMQRWKASSTCAETWSGDTARAKKATRRTWRQCIMLWQLVEARNGRSFICMRLKRQRPRVRTQHRVANTARSQPSSTRLAQGANACDVRGNSTDHWPNQSTFRDLYYIEGTSMYNTTNQLRARSTSALNTPAAPCTCSRVQASCRMDILHPVCGD